MPASQTKSYRVFYISAIVFLLAWLIISLMGKHEWGGIPMALGLISLGIAFRGAQFTKGFSYTVIILAVVSLAMYYPQNFRTVGNKDASYFIPFLLQIIMFGMGTELSLKDFAQVLRMPKGVIIGIVCHYTIMPMVGFGVAHLFNFPDEIAAGIILIGCCPSGLASNVMCYLARANLALSVSVTAISTLLAPFLTPVLMKLLAGSLIEVDLMQMVKEIVNIVLLPIFAGLIFHYLVRGKMKWLDKVLPVLSMVGIGFVLVIITAKGRDNLLKVGGLLIVATFIHNIAGYFLGYWSARLLKFPEKDSRTIALEVGMQNAGLASALAAKMLKAGTVGLASVIFGTMMNVTGSALASWWHNRIPKEDEEAEAAKSLNPATVKS